MNKVIILDTNNWIYLSNGFNVYSNKHDELHLKIFDKIKKWSEQGLITFIINDIILEEWERNKKEAFKRIDEINNRFKSYSKNLEVLKKFIGYTPSEINQLQDILKKEYDRKVKKHEDHITSVENFIRNSPVKIPVTNDIKIQAADIALQKKAPFIGEKKNSMADALLLFSSLAYISKNRNAFSESFFVSSNRGDFSSQEDKEVIHPDLKPILEESDTKFYFTLGKLVQAIEDEFLTAEELKVIEYANEPRYCEVCDYQYHPTVEFSDYIEVFNPYKTKQYKDPNQLDLWKGETVEGSTEIENESNFSEIRTADCSRCGAEYIECVCGELVHIEEYNTSLECNGCGLRYSVNADVDRKGMIHSLEYEIIENYRCSKCGGEFESVDEQGMCEECAEYEKLINE